jgi:hypothetical protein
MCLEDGSVFSKLARADDHLKGSSDRGEITYLKDISQTLSSQASKMDIVHQNLSSLETNVTSNLTRIGSYNTTMRDNLATIRKQSVETQNIVKQGMSSLEGNVASNLSKISPCIIAMGDHLKTIIKLIVNQDQSPTDKSVISNLSKISSDIAIMSNHLATINDNMALQTKHQRIDWAIANTEKDASSFDYYVKPDSYMFNGKKSTEAVKLILTAFRKGKNVDIHEYSKYMRDGSANDEGGAEFRVAISEQLESLLGTPPRIVSHKGKWTINYQKKFNFRIV